jgi:chromosome segregation ATPase
MSTLAVNPPDLPMAADDLQALEERVFRTIELLKLEREGRAAAESRVKELEQRGEGLQRQLDRSAEEVGRLEGELATLQQERDQVRGRVERLLKHLDDFTA